MRNRIKLEVFVDLDAVPGEFHTKQAARDVVYRILVDRISHYDPSVNTTSIELKDGVFSHKCVNVECDANVQFDDEPYCFTHSPDEGSSMRGYSAFGFYERDDRR